VSDEQKIQDDGEEREAADLGDEPDVEGHWVDTGDGHVDTGDGERQAMDDGDGAADLGD
jgi:hypothetical protein